MTSPVPVDRQDAEEQPGDAADWEAFVGALKESPNWNGDPQAVQEAMRREWD